MRTNPTLPYIIAGATGAIVASAIPFLIPPSKADTKLLPFQGRLTDSSGSAIADGAKVVEFKMYDAPTGGNVKWAGEVHQLSVNGGLVNTMLGSKASLGSVDFGTPSFLQITVDANGDGQITAADPPLLPRQSVTPAVFANEANNSRKLAGNDWSTFIVSSQGNASNDPSSGYINAGKILPASVTATQLQDLSVTSPKIQDSAVTSTKIQDGTIVAADLSTSLQADSLVPPGSVMAFAGTVPPPGWKFCDGSSQLRTDPAFSRLFGIIGTAHGAADGTHFNLPDYQGRFLRGVDGTTNRDPDRDQRSSMNPNGLTGNKVGSVQGHAFQTHTHIQDSHNHPQNPHDHGWVTYGQNGPVAQVNSGGSNGGIVSVTASVGNGDYANHPSKTLWTRSVTATNQAVTAVNQNAAATGANSSPSSGETRPVNAYVNYIIKL